MSEDLEWRKVLLGPDASVEQAIEVLNRVALRIVMVVDDAGRLLGTVTDGDIRRGLLRHLGIDVEIREVMFETPRTARVSDDRHALLAMMQSRGLLQLPLLDDNGVVVGLETLQHLLENDRYDNPVFLMAGGFGKRLSPLTDDIPKPLLKVGSKPILETILTQFAEAGFHHFYISTHYKAEMVREHFGNGERWGVSISYVHEGEPLGTAGALGLLPADLPKLPIIMMNGDLLTKVNFEHLLRFHEHAGGVATVCVREYDFQVPYGVIQSKEHRITEIVEKPVHRFFVNAGIYVLEPEIVEGVSGASFLDMPSLLESKIQVGAQINSFPIHEYWLDIGRMEEYQRANQDVDGD